MPEWGPIGEQVFNRTYARTKEDGTKETFDEVVDRMVRGNLALTPEHVDDGEQERLVELISQHKLVPAGRHWWVSGVPGRQFLFNCHRAGWTDQLADHVGFLFDELMKGGGVGANYSNEYMQRMHRIRRRVYVEFWAPVHADRGEMIDVWNVEPPNEDYAWAQIYVDDSREGWVRALEELCRYAQMEGPDIKITFDLSDVRPRGSAINGFGGTASGPGPLFRMLSEVSDILARCVGYKMTGIDAMLIDHAIASCVVAGNVRRSARMSIMHWQDEDIFDFIRLKSNGGHWTTNISVEVDADFWDLLERGDAHAQLVFDSIVEGMHRNGEPGIYDSTNGSVGERGDVRCTNPCGEIALEEWEQCNLGHINLAKVRDMDEAIECGQLMARWLLRATTAKGSAWRQWEVVQRNRRIGVGLLGFQEWLWRQHKTSYIGSMTPVAQSLQELYYAVMVASDQYSQELGIAAPIKITTVAPTGTTAKISGVTEGIHPVYSRYFIRRVRYATSDPGLQAAIDAGLHVEPDLVNPNTMVVEYPCRDSALDVVPEHMLQSADELTPDQMLLMQKMVQWNWADNAVSYTVNFDPHRWSTYDIARVLRIYGPLLKGTTFMPEGSYRQAPLQRITKVEYEAETVQMVGSSADECATGVCPVR